MTCVLYTHLKTPNGQAIVFSIVRPLCNCNTSHFITILQNLLPTNEAQMKRRSNDICTLYLEVFVIHIFHYCSDYYPAQ